MKATLARIVAIVVAGSALALGGSAVASADGSGTSSTQAAGDQLAQLRQELVDRAYTADVPGTQRALGQMSPLLGDLATGEQYTVQSDTRETAASAQDDATTASRIIADPAQAEHVKQAPAVPSALPNLPPPLDIVADLLKTLIQKLTDLLNALVGNPPALTVPTS
ncbi:hypothetical protein [Amycolatopsis viridis]|uniref:Secreted protein n=1 Tax=Amycolatopsis viridis TaxID=185678 RepID=A0ABX0SQW8_9PSEU|nr:hypothetical protein [Amycolatopsis viridis]NIH78059.1 hypothetical protein [Amycolatopsis viridis]